MDLVLKNCKFVNGKKDYYIAIKNGKISKISKNPVKAKKIVDIKNFLVLPGLIDPHVHFRDPGFTYKEDFKTGSQAAANGGFTTVLEMPNTNPKTNTAKNFKEKIKIGLKKCIIDFGLHAMITNTEEVLKIAKLKPASFKIFMDLQTDLELEQSFKSIKIANNELNKENNPQNNFKNDSENNLKFSSKDDSKVSSKNSSKDDFNLPKKLSIKLTAHCENKYIVDENTKKFKKLGFIKENTAIDYSYARESKSEDVSVLKAIDLSKKYNISLHLCHISSKNALKIIENEKKGMDLSYEITPHHLLLNNTAFNTYGTIAKTNPPLRPIGENLTLNDLNSSTLIGTDHAPHKYQEKNLGVWDSLPGIPNLETTLSLLLTEVNNRRIDLNLIPQIMSQNPAKVFNLKNKGTISVGKDADFVIVDMKKEGKFNIDEFYTKAKYSPFEGYSYKGKAIMTISRGNIVMCDGACRISGDNDSQIYKNKGQYVYD
jgi:dihydroorotase